MSLRSRAHDRSSIRNVSLVLQDGDAYYPAELYGELGVKPFAPALKPQPSLKPDPALKPDPTPVVAH